MTKVLVIDKPDGAIGIPLDSMPPGGDPGQAVIRLPDGKIGWGDVASPVINLPPTLENWSPVDQAISAAQAWAMRESLQSSINGRLSSVNRDATLTGDGTALLPLGVEGGINALVPTSGTTNHVLTKTDGGREWRVLPTVREVPANGTINHILVGPNNWSEAGTNSFLFRGATGNLGWTSRVAVTTTDPTHALNTNFVLRGGATAGSWSWSQLSLVVGDVTGLQGALDNKQNRIPAGADHVVIAPATLGGEATVRARSEFVQTTGAQTIDGVKTFNSLPILQNAGTLANNNNAASQAQVYAVQGMVTNLADSTQTGITGVATNPPVLLSPPATGEQPATRPFADFVLTSGNQDIGGRKTITDTTEGLWFTDQNSTIRRTASATLQIRGTTAVNIDSVLLQPVRDNADLGGTASATLNRWRHLRLRTDGSIDFATGGTITRPAENVIRTTATAAVEISSPVFRPTAANTTDLGADVDVHQFRDLYLSRNAIVPTAPTVGSHLTNKTYVDGIRDTINNNKQNNLPWNANRSVVIGATSATGQPTLRLESEFVQTTDVNQRILGKKTFGPETAALAGTVASLNLAPRAANPTTVADGDLWVMNTAAAEHPNGFRVRINGEIRHIITNTQAQTITGDKTFTTGNLILGAANAAVGDTPRLRLIPRDNVPTDNATARPNGSIWATSDASTVAADLRNGLFIRLNGVNRRVLFREEVIDADPTLDGWNVSDRPISARQAWAMRQAILGESLSNVTEGTGITVTTPSAGIRQVAINRTTVDGWYLNVAGSNLTSRSNAVANTPTQVASEAQVFNLNRVTNATYDSATHILTLNRQGLSDVAINLVTASFVESITYDPVTKLLRFVTRGTPPNNIVEVPLNEFVDIYTGGANSQISVSVNSTTNVITATLVNGGVIQDHLSQALRDRLDGFVTLGTPDQVIGNGTTNATVGRKTFGRADHASSVKPVLNLPHRSVPDAAVLVNGDVWTQTENTTAGLMVRLGGASRTVMTLQSQQIVAGAKEFTGANTVTGTGAITFGAAADAGRAQLRLAQRTNAADPTGVVDGDIWLNANFLNARVNGATHQLMSVNTAQTVSAVKTFTAEPVLPSKSTLPATPSATSPATEAQVGAVSTAVGNIRQVPTQGTNRRVLIGLATDSSQWTAEANANQFLFGGTGGALGWTSRAAVTAPDPAAGIYVFNRHATVESSTWITREVVTAANPAATLGPYYFNKTSGTAGSWELRQWLRATTPTTPNTNYTLRRGDNDTTWSWQPAVSGVQHGTTTTRRSQEQLASHTNTVTIEGGATISNVRILGY